MKKSISFILVLIVVTACYHDSEIKDDLILRPSEVYKFEIELPIHNEGRGGRHMPDLKKYEYDNSDWIYINTDKGGIDAKDMVLTHERNKIEYPYCQSNLKGYIEFQNDSLKIDLMIPHYKNQDTIPYEWFDFDHNGTYKVKVEL